MRSPLRNFAWTTEACWFFQAKKPSEKIVGILDERSGDTVHNSTQRQRQGRCHPNATPGVLPSPLSKCSSIIRRKYNTGGGNRTHTGVPAQRILSPRRLPWLWHWTDFGVTFKLLFNQRVTPLTFMGSIVAALGSHGHLSYQTLTRSGGSRSYRQGPQLDDPTVQTAGGRATV